MFVTVCLLAGVQRSVCICKPCFVETKQTNAKENKNSTYMLRHTILSFFLDQKHGVASFKLKAEERKCQSVWRHCSDFLSI